MLLSFVAIVLFVVVVVVVDTMFFIFSIPRCLLPPLGVLPAFVCAVFQYASAFNSDISAWNTGAVIDMGYSKSFIDRCFFCLWQLLLFVVVVVVVDNVFYLLNSSSPSPSTCCSTCCCLRSVPCKFSLQFGHFGMEHGGRDRYVTQ
jgi:surface protein